MTSLTRDNSSRLQMTACLAEYGVILDSSDCLIKEVEQSETLAGTIDTAELPLRNRIAKDSLVKPSGRAAGIGIATVVCYVDPQYGALHALLGRRSYDVGTYPDTWHVIPAGMLNYRFGGTDPNGTHTRPWGRHESCDVAYTILSEYAEEAFKRLELEQNTRRAAVRAQPSVQSLIDHGAELFFTGVAIDLGNLRPEICALIYVPNAEWHDGQTFDLCAEWIVPPRAKHKQLRPICVAEHDAQTGINHMNDEAETLLQVKDTVPAGAAAFWKGIDLARKVYEDDLLHGGRWRRKRGSDYTVESALRQVQRPSDSPGG